MLSPFRCHPWWVGSLVLDLFHVTKGFPCTNDVIASWFTDQLYHRREEPIMIWARKSILLPTVMNACHSSSLQMSRTSEKEGIVKDEWLFWITRFMIVLKSFCDLFIRKVSDKIRSLEKPINPSEDMVPQPLSLLFIKYLSFNFFSHVCWILLGTW